MLADPSFVPKQLLLYPVITLEVFKGSYKDTLPVKTQLLASVTV